MPAILAVSAVSAAPACNEPDDKKVTTAPSTTDPTDGTTTDTTTDPTEDPTAATMATGTDTDGVPVCKEIPDQATCEATPLCTWPPEIERCTVDCEKIDDEAVCGTKQFCAWIDGKCELLLI